MRQSPIKRLERSPQWVWVAIDPESKLLLAIDVGDHTLAMAQRVVHHVAQVVAPDFRQILKTSHMGSALFGPMVWRGQMLGQVLTATQARHTYSPMDLDLFMGFAYVAAAVYMAYGGPAWLRTRG